MFSKSLTKHFKDFCRVFTELHAEFDADTFDFCHPSQTEGNTKSKKHSYKNNTCSQHSVTWQTDFLQVVFHGQIVHHFFCNDTVSILFISELVLSFDVVF
jgi:hypothetical protein